jgi:hypothetical protein
MFAPALLLWLIGQLIFMRFRLPAGGISGHAH